MSQTQGGRIVGLDTVKFIAIVLIVVYHCFPGLLPGGFLAVDIFFVISGFLIGQKLFRKKDKEAERFGGPKSFLKFVGERLRRFLPSLIFCMIVALSLAYFANPDLLTNARQNSFFALTFSTNIAAVVTESTYENALIPNLFNQTWFLALELQVCIVCFLSFAFFFNIYSRKEEKNKRARLWLFLICFIIAVISFALMGIYGGYYGLYDRAYFGPDSHIGAFFLGAALAVLAPVVKLHPQKTFRWVTYLVLVMSIAGILVMTPVIHYSSKEAFLIGLPVTSILAVILLIAILKLQPIRSESAVPKSLRLFEYLGSLSFAIYLLHYSIQIILLDLLNFCPSSVVSCITITISVVLAILLQKVIYPFSKKHRLSFVIILFLSLILPILSLIKAPTKSSIEKSLEEGAAVMEAESSAEAEEKLLDYTGTNALGVLLNNDVMQFFDASEEFANPSPARAAYVAYGENGGGGRDYYDAPDYSKTSQLDAARAMIIGDSVVLGATQAIYDTIPAVFVDAMGSRNMFDAINLLAGYRASNGGSLPYIIVLGLITNYPNFGADTLATIMDVAGPGHQFVFLTGYCGEYSRSSQNATIQYVADNYSNAHVADWAAIVTGNVGYYTNADHIHLSAAGRIEYANLINQVISGL